MHISAKNPTATPMRFGVLQRPNLEQLLNSPALGYLNRETLISMLEGLPKHQTGEQTDIKRVSTRNQWLTKLEKYLTTFSQREKKLCTINQPEALESVKMANLLARIMASKEYNPSDTAFKSLFQEFMTWHQQVNDPPLLDSTETEAEKNK